MTGEAKGGAVHAGTCDWMKRHEMDVFGRREGGIGCCGWDSRWTSLQIRIRHPVGPLNYGKMLVRMSFLGQHLFDVAGRGDGD